MDTPVPTNMIGTYIGSPNHTTNYTQVSELHKIRFFNDSPIIRNNTRNNVIRHSFLVGRISFVCVFGATSWSLGYESR